MLLRKEEDEASIAWPSRHIVLQAAAAAAHCLMVNWPQNCRLAAAAGDGRSS